MASQKQKEEKVRDYGYLIEDWEFGRFIGGSIHNPRTNEYLNFRRRSKRYRAILDDVYNQILGQQPTDWFIQINNQVWEIHWQGVGQWRWHLKSNGFEFKIRSVGRPSNARILREITNYLYDETLSSGGYENFIRDGGNYYYEEIKGVRETKDLISIDVVDFTLRQQSSDRTPMASRPTFNNEAISELFLGEEIDYENSKLCTPENIMYFINKNTGLRLQRYSLRDIVNQFCIVKNYDGNDKYGFLQSNGITADDVIEWTYQFANGYVNVYCINPANKLFRYTKNGNARYKLVLKINNDHSYIVSNRVLTQQVVENGEIKQTRLKEDVNIETIKFINDSNELVSQIDTVEEKNIIVNENWKNLICSYVNQNNTLISEINISDGDITSFKCPLTDKTILIRENMNKMLDIYNQLSKYNDIYTDIKLPQTTLQYRGQSMGKLAIDLINNIAGIIPHSHYNKEVMEYLDKFKYPRVVETYDYTYNENDDNKAYDITKAHSYARMNMLGDIPIYSIHDGIEPYDGGDIKTGKYRIRSTYMFNGKYIYIPEGFYTHGFVNKMLNEGIISHDDILEQYLCKTSLPSNFLVKLTEFVFKVFNEDDAKNISNIQTGLFGKIYNKSQEAYLSNSWDMVSSMVLEGYYPYTLSDDLFMITKSNKVRMTSDTRPIWNTIVETSIWNLYEKMKMVVNEDSVIHGIKVDCIYGKNLNVIETIESKNVLENIGGIHEITYSKLNKLPVYEIKNQRMSFRHYEWKINRDVFTCYNRIVRQSCLITGIGGSGKSYTLKQMLKHTDNALVIAPTHTAVARLKREGINTRTIDSALKISVNGFSKPKYPNEFPYDFLYVDECYNTSVHHQQLIYDIWSKNPHVRVFFFGDKRQCLPVEVEEDDNSNGVVLDYDVSLAWKQMLVNKVDLPYNASVGRYDDDLYKQVIKLEKNEIPTIQKYEEQKEVKRFLAKTNKKVDDMNMLIMEDKKDYDEFKLPVNKGSSKCKIEIMKLENGDPVMAYKNNRKGLFHNNQQFEYAYQEDNKVYLINRDNDEVEIEKDVFIKSFVPAFCITINRCQGEAMDGKFAILEGWKLNKNDLNSAITRGKKWENVFIDRLPCRIRPYKYTEHTTLNVSSNSFKACIYKMFLDDMVYVGQSRDLMRRYEQHLFSEEKDDFHSAITDENMYNWDIEVLEETYYSNQKELNEREKYFIDLFSSNEEFKLLNTVNKKKEKKKVIEKKVVEKVNKKVKGISDQPKYNRWCVKKKGVKRKNFSYRKMSKEEAYKMAKDYVDGKVVYE